MPEGDTVFKLAASLRPLLDGKVLGRVELRDVTNSRLLAGRRVLELETVGKHLLIHLDNDHLVRVHLGMHGSWHRYRQGERWRRSRSSAKVILETDQSVVVCFEPMEVELLPRAHRRWHRQLTSLGPDLLSEDEPDWNTVLERALSLVGPSVSLAELLLDQRVAAGLGNVYKSELAFMGPLESCPFTPAGVSFSPWEPWVKLEPDQVKGLYRRGRELLRANLGGWARTTRAPADLVGAERLYVYGRAGHPCWRCGASVESRGQERLTYWCPECQ